MLSEWVQYLVDTGVSDEISLRHADLEMRRRFKYCARKSQLLHVYNSMIAQGMIAPDNPQLLRTVLVKKASKSQSGVLVITGKRMEGGGRRYVRYEDG